MDKQGNIYSIEQMRRELDSMGADDPRRKEFERALSEDEGRLDGYLRGRSDAEQEAALKEMQHKLEAALAEQEKERPR